jgi:predicted RNA binding protein YcfA (HicA-like mRNA interferase family)
VKLPRDVSGRELVSALSRIGYHQTGQTGSHVRLTTLVGGEHHVTIPMHNPIRAGTLNAILKDVARHADIDRATLLDRLFS